MNPLVRSAQYRRHSVTVAPDAGWNQKSSDAGDLLFVMLADSSTERELENVGGSESVADGVDDGVFELVTEASLDHVIVLDASSDGDADAVGDGSSDTVDVRDTEIEGGTERVLVRRADTVTSARWHRHPFVLFGKPSPQ
jgi:hypothetical protein